MFRTIGVAALCMFLLAACGDDPVLGVDDAGVLDASAAPDAAGDASVLDALPPDTGPVDGGFFDPDVILEGIEVVKGLRTYVKLMGTTTSTLPPVLFLHTGPGLAHEYLPEPMRFLVPGRLLAFYDMRATGRTSYGGTGSVTTTITARVHTDDVGDVIDFLRDQMTFSKVDLVGHGYGASIAALYAADHPEDVSKLVLVAPYPADVDQLTRFNVETRIRLSSADRTRIDAITSQPACFGDESRCAIEVWSIMGPHFLCEPNRDQFADLTFMYGSYRSKFFVERQLRDSAYDWSDRLAQISVPTTVISGPCDPAPPETALTYSSTIAGAEHRVLSGTGHFPMVEDAPRFQSVMREALAP